MMLLLLLVLVLFLCFLHILLNCNRKVLLIRKIPGPNGVFLAGNALDIALSAEDFFLLMRRYHNNWSTINRLYTFGVAAVNIYTPQDIEVVLSNTKHNTKSRLYNFLKSWLRDGLLLSNGTKWQTRRKILTPAFHFNILREFYVIFDENSQRLVRFLKQYSGQHLDVIPAISEFTLNSICETAMGTQLNNEISEAGQFYKDALHKLGSQFVHRITRIYLHSDFVYNLTTFGKLRRHLNVVHNFTKGVIDSRRKYVEKNGIKISENSEDVTFYTKKKIAMLDLLLNAEKDGIIDSAGIQEEVDTFMFEGHDTTATGLIYCMMMFANHKAVQDKIVAELNDIYGGSTRPAKMEDLIKMRYLECCIKETLRLYPPVPIIGRVLSEDTVLSGYLVPAGTYCHIQIYDVHRNKDMYPEPLVFNPDRFLSEKSIGRHPYGYIPFSAGPRNCIGQKFALLQMKSVLSEVLRQFELLPVTKPSDLRFILDLVLRTTHPVYVKFANRNKN